MFVKYKKCLEIAHALKPEAQNQRSFHVAFLYHKNKLISIAQNSTKTHPRNNELGATDYVKGRCAELNVVLKSKRVDFKDCVMFVVRINNNGEEAAMSKPCTFCQKLCEQINMKKVYYSISNKEYGALNF